VTSAVRVFFVGGRISYRALFNWISPTMYTTTMLVGPFFQVLFFVYLGRYAGNETDSFFIVGNSIQVCGLAGIFGMIMGIANERQFGTLSPLLATPANRVALFLGRGLPHIVNGIVVSTFSLALSWLLLDFSPEPASLPSLALVLAVSTFACTSFGMTIGSIGLRARDVFFAGNLVFLLMLLLCGVNVSVDDLPGWLEAIARAIPLTHGIEAGREVVAGASLGSVQGLLLTELLIGVVYAGIGYTLFRLFEAEGRRRGSLETF
jgi:ABC-2 type transport system permease protein